LGLSIYEKELSAVEKWRHYLEGSQFIIKMDHENLKFSLQQRLHMHLQKKGMAKLMGLDYIIQYKKGRENMAVDALSICHEEGSSAAIIVITPDWYQEVVTSYEGDEKIKELLEQLILDPNGRPGYTLTKGVIRYHGRLIIGNCEPLKKKILHSFHEFPLGGHSGIQNTYYKVKQRFYWPQLKKFVTDFVMAFDTCRRCKYETVAYPSLLQPLVIPA